MIQYDVDRVAKVHDLGDGDLEGLEVTSDDLEEWLPIIHIFAIPVYRDRAVAPQPKLEMAWEKTVARGDVLQEGCEGIRATTYGILHDNVGVFENLSDLWGCKTNLA